MGLIASVLANLIVTNIEAIPNFPTSGVSPIISDTRVIQAIASAIVSHIQANAVVPAGIPVLVDTGTGVGATTGTGEVE